MNQIKAFTMDMDGMLVEGRQNFKEAITPNNISDEIRDEVLALWTQMKQFKKGEITENEYRDYVRETFGITTTNDEIYQLFQTTYALNEELVQKAQKAREQGIQVCVVTNNFPTRFQALIEEFHLNDLIDVLIASYQVKATKPDTKIFQELIDQTGLEPNQIAYADDNPDKLQGAKDLGIHTFSFDNNEDYFQHLKELWIDLT